MRLRIDLKIFIFFVLFYFTQQIKIYSLILIFAIIHELGHLLAGLILKFKPERIELMPFGLTVSFKMSNEEYKFNENESKQFIFKKILVALARTINKYYYSN